jgi:hypothetical protein
MNQHLWRFIIHISPNNLKLLVISLSIVVSVIGLKDSISSLLLIIVLNTVGIPSSEILFKLSKSS